MNIIHVLYLDLTGEESWEKHKLPKITTKRNLRNNKSGNQINKICWNESILHSRPHNQKAWTKLLIYCESGFSYHRNNLLRNMNAESSAQFLYPLSSTHFTQEKICKTRCFDRIPSAMKTISDPRMMKTWLQCILTSVVYCSQFIKWSTYTI